MLGFDLQNAPLLRTYQSHKMKLICCNGKLITRANSAPQRSHGAAALTVNNDTVKEARSCLTEAAHTILGLALTLTRQYLRAAKARKVEWTDVDL